MQITSVLAKLADPRAAAKAPESWCAAHLNMLCNFAIRAYEAHGKFPSGAQRGMLVNYESLPGAVPRALLPMFGVRDVSTDWLRRMSVEAQSYSKSRGTRLDHSFGGDSRDKEARSTPGIRKYAREILLPTYVTCARLGAAALAAVLTPSSLDELRPGGEEPPPPGKEVVDWAKLSDIPTQKSVSPPLTAPLGVMSEIIALAKGGGRLSGNLRTQEN